MGRRFGRRYRQLIDAVQAGDREAADAALGELDADNLDENAYLEFARFARHSRWGSAHQQLDALQRAVGWDRRTSYLPDDLLQDALRNLFTLQLQMQDFGGALNTGGRLRELPLEEEFAGKLEATVREVEAFRHEDVAIAVEGLIDDASYSWHLNLFRNAFYIDRVEGRLAEIKLRCAEEFVGFAFHAELVYRIAQQHMPCSLEAVGDPGTRFRVVQSRAAAGG